jgi:hypothetical protein
MGFRLQTTEKLNINSEEGYKIQIVRCLFFEKTDIKARREEALAHRVTQQERHRGKNPEKSILEGLLARGGLALCFQRQGVL